jgi:hypothetical protein
LLEHTLRVDKLAQTRYKCKPQNGEEVRYGGQRERLQGGPGPATTEHPLPEGAVRQPGGRGTKRLQEIEEARAAELPE